MKYYVLLMIQAPNTEHFIEVGLNYEIPFHPNLTDQMEAAGFTCEIKEIYYNLDDLSYATIKAKAIDNLLSMRNNPPPEIIQEWLIEEWIELKEWAERNGEIVILNDYSFPFKA